MFDKISQAAERLAAGLSRRDLLGRSGQGALALVVGALGGLFGLPDVAQANQSECCRSVVPCCRWVNTVTGAVTSTGCYTNDKKVTNCVKPDGKGWRFDGCC